MPIDDFLSIGVWPDGANRRSSDSRVGERTALHGAGGEWKHRVKLSEQAIKVTTPGVLAVRRYLENGTMAADVIYDELVPPGETVTLVHPMDPTRRRAMPRSTTWRELLVPVVRGGDVVYDLPSIHDTRAYAKAELATLSEASKRFMFPCSSAP